MRALTTLAQLSPPGPTAIVCSNDLMAIGVMRQAYEHQISIPPRAFGCRLRRYLALAIHHSPLTTVQMSPAELAKLAFGALIADVERDSAWAACHEYGLATNLVLRKTTALAFTGA
jgi:DNA-binding LacI/PurR family transcriptional regulator